MFPGGTCFAASPLAAPQQQPVTSKTTGEAKNFPATISPISLLGQVLALKQSKSEKKN